LDVDYNEESDSENDQAKIKLTLIVNQFRILPFNSLEKIKKGNRYRIH